MSFNISGQILINGSPLFGVNVSNAQNGNDPAVTTDVFGNYTLVVANSGLTTVLPQLDGYGFNPVSQNLFITGDVTGIDFAAQLEAELIRQKLPVDFTSGFSGSDGFSGLLVLGNTRIDLVTGDIFNVAGDGFISGFSSTISSGTSGFSGVSGFSGNTGSSGASGSSGSSGGSGASGASGFSGFSGQNTSAGTVYFLHNESSDVVGEDELLVDGPDIANTDLPFTIGADTTTALKSWVTNVNEPGTAEWSRGEYRLDFVAWKDNATQATAFFNVYRRDGAIRTLLGTSFQTPNLTTTPTHYMISWQNPDDINVSTTTRFEIEIEAIDVGGGGTQVVHIGIEGNAGDSTDYASHIHTGVTSAFGTSGKSGTSGFSGFSSQSGASGFSGFSANSGQSGYSGTSGATGDSGQSGTSGATGDSGTSGTSGFSGSTGQSGFSGFSGTIGTSGFSGFSSDSGLSGFSGSTGNSGFSGQSGFSATSGQSGASGFSGLSGFSSNSGVSGFSGSSGFSGGSGFSGTSGSSGASGTTGFSGFSGFSAATFSALKYIFLDVQGGVDDNTVSAITEMPFLIFTSSANARARWTLFVPDDWISGTNMNIDIYWSPANAAAGSVFWFTEAKALAIGQLVSGANMTGTLTQASPGIAYQLASTGSNLFISGASMAAGDLIQAVVGRSGAAAADTYNGNAQVHHVRLEYLAKRLK